jgi:hypothetical protein
MIKPMSVFFYIKDLIEHKMIHSLSSKELIIGRYIGKQREREKERDKERYIERDKKERKRDKERESLAKQGSP